MPELLIKKKTDSEVTEFVRKIFGIDLWWMQEDILNTVLNERYTVVRSCHAIGKSFIAALISIVFLILNPRSIVITTAPTWNQVRNILWREIHKMYGRARINEFFECGFGGTLNQTELTFGAQWYALGISPRPDQVERIQGFHSETGNVLVIADESPGCNPQIIDAAETSLMTGPGAHMLLIGNPTEPAGHFYDAFSDPKFCKFHVPFSITPNGASGVDSVPFLITNVWVYEMIKKWGEAHPFVVNKVLAEFTSKGGKNIIPLAYVEKAMNETKPAILEGEKWMGIDIAESGDDHSAIAYRQGKVLFKLKKYHHHDTMKITGWIIQEMRTFNPEDPKKIKVHLDTIGVGKGVYDRLREQGYTNVKSVRSSKSPIDKENYANLKTEIWWTFREKLRDGEILLVKNEELKSDLVSPIVEPDSAGRLLMERKKDTKKRLNRSPDLGDAAVLAFCKPTPNLRIFV